MFIVTLPHGSRCVLLVVLNKAMELGLNFVCCALILKSLSIADCVKSDNHYTGLMVALDVLTQEMATYVIKEITFVTDQTYR